MSMQPIIRAGDLRRRITIQQRTNAQGAFGEQLKTWSDLVTTWAHIESLSGNQLARAQSIYTEVSHQITVRWQSILTDIKSTDSYRVLYGNRIFDIGGDLNVDERNRVVILLCKEGLNDGQ